MKKLIIIPIILSVLALGGCTIIFNTPRESNAWHAKDLETFLEENYPIGSDEKLLIRDFTDHGYKYDRDSRTLTAEAYCSWFFGVSYGVVINWLPHKGKITSITSRKIGPCLLLP